MPQFKDVELRSDNMSTKESHSNGDSAMDKGVTVEEAIMHAGGFGRFQYRVCLLFQMMMSCGSFALYPMMYYELIPKYLCKDR